jgi:hypothetical protein
MSKPQRQDPRLVRIDDHWLRLPNKDIGPVVSSLHQAGVAQPLAELQPLLTIKG